MQLVKGLADSAAGLSPNISPGKGKVSVTQQAKISAEIDAKIAVMKRNATMAFQELTQLMADISQEKLTKPRKVKIFGYKNLTVEDVTKKNFKDVKLVSKATPSEDSEQNKAIKQKAKIELYELFKDDPKVPGQLAMRRSVAKSFDIQPTEIESWFTEEEKTPQAQTQMPQQQPEVGGGNPPNEDTALLSQTGREAQINVPRSIK